MSWFAFPGGSGTVVIYRLSGHKNCLVDWILDFWRETGTQNNDPQLRMLRELFSPNSIGLKQ